MLHTPMDGSAMPLPTASNPKGIGWLCYIISDCLRMQSCHHKPSERWVVSPVLGLVSHQAKKNPFQIAINDLKQVLVQVATVHLPDSM